MKFGDDPAIAADAAQKARGEGALTQVEALQNSDPLFAKKVLENNRNILPPETYDNLVNRLRPMIAGATVDQAIRRAASGEPIASGQPTTAAPAAGQPAEGSPSAPAQSAPSGKMPTPYELAGARSRVAVG